jgi:hypothetical protein
MNDGLYAALYSHTCEKDMLDLDAERREAEADPERADWASLARKYEAQGRPAMAAKCMERGRYYGVSVTSAAVCYA